VADLAGAARLVPDLAPDLVEGGGGPGDDVEGVHAAGGLGAAPGDHVGDPGGGVRAHLLDLPAALGAQLVEEAFQGRLVAARPNPDQLPAIVVDDHDQVALASPVGDLVDPDPAQAGQPITTAFSVRGDAGDDGAHAAPGDTHEFSDGGQVAARDQPGHLVLERPAEAAALPGPGHGGHHHAVPPAADSGRRRLQVGGGGAQVQHPPAPDSVALVVAGAALVADSAAPLLPAAQPDRDGQVPLRIELHRLYRRPVPPSSGRRWSGQPSSHLQPRRLSGAFSPRVTSALDAPRRHQFAAGSPPPTETSVAPELGGAPVELSRQGCRLEGRASLPNHG
jgi:hypothetical protein